MRESMSDGDSVLCEPPSGTGATLTIRYLLPRPWMGSRREPPLEVGDGAEDVEHEIAGGRGGVEAFLEQGDFIARPTGLSGLG